MTRIILVRHGETLKNVEGKTHKYSDLESLTPYGIDQINLVANALREYFPDIIYSSKENRANESAKIISTKLNLKIIEVQGLEERNWGDFAGLPFDELKSKTGLEKMTFTERYTFHPPNGESWKEVEERLLITLYKILNENPDKTIILVTHGGCIRTLMPTLLNVGKEESYKYDPVNASISVFDYNKGKFSKILYNNTVHL